VKEDSVEIKKRKLLEKISFPEFDDLMNFQEDNET